MGSKKGRSKKSEDKSKSMSDRNRLSMIPEDDTVIKPETKNEDDKNQFVDVAASLNALVDNPPLPQLEERPPSRRGLVPRERPKGVIREVNPQVELSREEKPLPPIPGKSYLPGKPSLPEKSSLSGKSSLPKKSSLPGESPQQESSVASDAVRPWPQAFGGTPRGKSQLPPTPSAGIRRGQSQPPSTPSAGIRRGQSQPPSTPSAGIRRGQSQPPSTPSTGTRRGRFEFHPVPFLDKGQVTYKGQTQFNTNIAIVIIWDAEKIWGQFTIDNGIGLGYIRADMKPDWKPAKNGETVTFHWRGLGNGRKVPPGDSTRSKFKFLKDGEEISGEMGPMDKRGRMNWVPSKDGDQYLEAKKFKFSGVRQAKSEINEDNAWKGWDLFK